MDPGILPPNKLYKNEQLNDNVVEKYQMSKSLAIISPVCKTCKQHKAPSTSHCKTCNNCVVFFDHHCSWLGCDIGIRNNYQFLIFTLNLTIYCAFDVLVLVLSLLSLKIQVFNLSILIIYAVINIFGAIKLIRLGVQQLRQLRDNTTTKEFLLDRINASKQLQVLLSLSQEQLQDEIFSGEDDLRYYYNLKQSKLFRRLVIGRRMPILKCQNPTEAERTSWKWTVALSGVLDE
ncbi:DHHC_palmitoyltransferase [Hexamita inflata]|uniref:Palmitoyltransferase n=1 Tax=Hexamita inflata TaxID=28002 RepID=A0AA86N585_9EUKA|nr:DHHC palmitoyltransferase [Hexamita inflata]